MLQRLSRASPAWLAVLAIAARILPSPRTIDDAFITFRYARNLGDGLGFVYNIGERVLGTTTPLYTLLLAGFSAVLGMDDYPWLALGLNALADGLTCALLVSLGERLSGHRAVGIGAGLLWAVAPMSVTFAIGGMETSLVILLQVATVSLYLADRTTWTAATAALALLARPDGLLFVGPLGIDLIFRRRFPRPQAVSSHRHWPWREIAAFSAILAPWAIFAQFYFGSPIAHSVHAKALAYHLPPASALLRLAQHYSTPFFEQLLFSNFYFLIALWVLYTWLAALGVLQFIRRDTRAWSIAAYPFLYFAVFAVVNPLIFRWYLAPPLPVYFLLILGGSHKVLSDLRHWIGQRTPNLYPLGLAAAVGLSLNAWTLHPDHGPDRPAPEMAWHQLELLYEQVGRELEPKVTADTVIAAGDVGALGYYSGARILDTVGLVSPQALPHYPLPDSYYVIGYAIPPDLIIEARPDLVVLLEAYGREGLLKDKRFVQAYTLVDRISTDIYGSRGMLIYERQ